MTSVVPSGADVWGRASPAVVNCIKAVSGSMATFSNSYFKKGHIKAQRGVSRSRQQKEER